MFLRPISIFISVLILSLFLSPTSWAGKKNSKDYQEYLNYFEKVYKTFEDNYYLAPDRKLFDDFIVKQFSAGVVRIGNADELCIGLNGVSGFVQINFKTIFKFQINDAHNAVDGAWGFEVGAVVRTDDHNMVIGI